MLQEQHTEYIHSHSRVWNAVIYCMQPEHIHRVWNAVIVCNQSIYTVTVEGVVHVLNDNIHHTITLYSSNVEYRDLTICY